MKMSQLSDCHYNALHCTFVLNFKTWSLIENYLSDLQQLEYLFNKLCSNISGI